MTNPRSSRTGINYIGLSELVRGDTLSCSNDPSGSFKLENSRTSLEWILCSKFISSMLLNKCSSKSSSASSFCVPSSEVICHLSSLIFLLKVTGKCYTYLNILPLFKIAFNRNSLMIPKNEYQNFPSQVTFGQKLHYRDILSLPYSLDWNVVPQENPSSSRCYHDLNTGIWNLFWATLVWLLEC